MMSKNNTRLSEKDLNVPDPAQTTRMLKESENDLDIRPARSPMIAK